jgi:hypothetical protein
MLSSRVLGYLNQLVSEEKSKALQKDPLTKIKEIHIGYVHVDLESEFIRATSEKQNFTLCEMNGIPIILNRLCEGGYKIIFEGTEYREPIINGVKPSKTWLKRYGIKQ